LQEGVGRDRKVPPFEGTRFPGPLRSGMCRSRRTTACCGMQVYAVWLSCPSYVAVERWIIE